MKTKLFIALTVILLLALVMPESAIRTAAQAGEPPLSSPRGEAGWENEPDHLRDRLFDAHPVESGSLAGVFQADLSPAEQPSLTAPFTAASVVANLSSTCVLSSEGGVKCWGDNASGRLGDGTSLLRTTPVSVVGLGSGVKMISSSHKHVCVVTNAGGVKCWGANGHGELGDGTTIDRLTPVEPVGLSSGVVSVTAGGFHTCALMATGGVKCWGVNWHGQVGDGSTVERHVPIDVYGMSDGIKQVVAGKYHTCALNRVGGVACWGYNLYGQVGNGSTTQRPRPTGVYGLSLGVKEITAGGLHTCAIDSQGGVVCWGDNSEGQLGNGTHNGIQTTPKPVTDLSSGIARISAGTYFTCALPTAGGMKCWGDDWAGQIGNGLQGRQLVPADVLDLPDQITSLGTGDSHTCVTTSTGKVKCWGSNAYGQLGDGTSALRYTPVDVLGLSNGVAYIGSGAAHTCALTSAGGVKCWGNNDYGQLGDGTTIYRLTPVDVYGMTSGVKAIAVGGYHTCALLQTGAVYCWGYNRYGQLGTNSTNRHLTPENVTTLKSGVIAVTAGFAHTCALMVYGGVKCWGDNGKGQLGTGDNKISEVPVIVVGIYGLQVIEISAGESHTCALLSTGAVKCWGNNYDGQLGNGARSNSTRPVDVSGLTGAQWVAAGLYHTCVLLAGGKVECWGGNYSGQLGDGTTDVRITPTEVQGLGGAASQLSAGTQHNCAVVNGGVKCWGSYGGAAPGLTPVWVSGLESGMAFVAAGASASCAVTSGGSAKCWGVNSNGQVGDGTVPWRLTPGLVPGLDPAQLAINFSSGQPGSYFTVSGARFLPNSQASLQVNGYTFPQKVTVDGNGSFVLRLGTAQAGEGVYFAAVQGIQDGVGATVTFRLAAGEAARADEGQGALYHLPPGIAYTRSAYLPVMRK